MKLIARVVLLALLPFLSGCLTSNTMDAVNATSSKTLPDRLFHVEKAVVTKDNQLCILFEGALTNSLQKSRFTLTAPLGQIQVSSGNYTSTNKIVYGVLRVPRSAIRQGWVQENLPADSKAIQVSSTVVIPDGSNLWDYVESYKPLPDSAPTLYPIDDLRGTNHYDWPVPMEFIYVDSSTNQAFTIMQVDQVKVESGKHYGYYILLPLTIPVDIATLPVQIPFILLMMGSIKC